MFYIHTLKVPLKGQTKALARVLDLQPNIKVLIFDDINIQPWNNKHRDSWLAQLAQILCC